MLWVHDVCAMCVRSLCDVCDACRPHIEEEAVHEGVKHHLSRDLLRAWRDHQLEQLQVAQTALGKRDDARTSGVDLVERDHVLFDRAPRPRDFKPPVENVPDHRLLAEHNCELEGRKLMHLEPGISAADVHHEVVHNLVAACDDRVYG